VDDKFRRYFSQKVRRCKIWYNLVLRATITSSAHFNPHLVEKPTMTRITDFGRKRTHVQAGFPDDSERVEEPAEPQASTSTLPSESQPQDQVPPKKKRKRTKKPKENGGDGEDLKTEDAGGSETAIAAPKKKAKDKRKQKSMPFATSDYHARTERL
jgi:zinc finger CCHC domain-containing protein 9